MRTKRDVAVSYWDQDWPDFREDLERAAERSRGPYPANAMNTLLSNIDRALLVHGSAWVAEHYASLGTTLDAVVAAGEELGMELGGGTMQKFALDLLGCEAAGIPVAPTTHAWIVRQCAAQSIHRDEEIELRWALGFAGLALGVPRLYRAVAGLLPEDPAPPFPPPPHHFANMQAWLQTFVGAIERKARWAEVEPHWRSMLEVWPYHGRTVGCSTTAVFFSAFAMNVRVRGAPPETTGDFFRDAALWADQNALTL